MNKEEILAKSRAENKMADEMELQIRLKAGKIAKVCGVVVAFILAFILPPDIILCSNSILGADYGGYNKKQCKPESVCTIYF